MSYESIPVEQRDVYLAAAEQACNLALQESLGDQAEVFLAACADTEPFANAVADFVSDNDLQAQLLASLEEPIDSGIVTGAEYLLKQHDESFEASELSKPTAQRQQQDAERADTISEIQDLLARGEADELYGLTIDKQTANHRVDESGAPQYQTGNGIWIGEDIVDAAQSRWGSNPTAQQMAAWFIQRKTLS